MARNTMWNLLAFMALVFVAMATDKQMARKSGDFVFEIEPRAIVAGESATLHWSIKGATKVVIEEARASTSELRRIGEFEATGSVQVHPKEDTTYILSCDGAASFSCASTSVRVRVKR